MPESFLKNPLSLFDIKGKTAIIAGASGALMGAFWNYAMSSLFVWRTR